MQKVRFKVIASGQLMILCSFIVDTLATVFLDEPALYAFFLYMTWVFVLIGAILYDTGWRLPTWLVNRYKKD
ncbi:MAG: hypothetical protein GY870_18130 [archaeon]|nr:hypothetical protein [archaeon]